MAEIVSEAALAEQQEDTLYGKYLVFGLDGQEFAVAMEYVVDIINAQPSTPVPGCPDFVRGITNLRGKVIPLMDVRLRFGKPLREYSDRTCIIVVEDCGVTVGLMVDRVCEAIALRDDQIAPPPPFHANVQSRFIKGLCQAESGIKLLLDCHAVLEDETQPPAENEQAELPD